jgi:hypothetical protein
MSKYATLVRILDRLRDEAFGTRYSGRYTPPVSEIEKTNQARSRAYIHLYLKVGFGLTDFVEREHFITDGQYDGGIDAYYIDTETRTVYFLQSKFRTTALNFETKTITLNEILVMDINRILEGETADAYGNTYNGKILGMARSINEIPDIARYSYKVILLANLDTVAPDKLRQLTGGHPVEVFDYERCYDKLVFPILSGTYFNASDLTIHLDLSNKSAGASITYSVQTKHHDCEITVLFVPVV